MRIIIITQRRTLAFKYYFTLLHAFALREFSFAKTKNWMVTAVKLITSGRLFSQENFNLKKNDYVEFLSPTMDETNAHSAVLASRNVCGFIFANQFCANFFTSLSSSSHSFTMSTDTNIIYLLFSISPSAAK